MRASARSAMSRSDPSRFMYLEQRRDDPLTAPERDRGVVVAGTLMSFLLGGPVSAVSQR